MINNTIPKGYKQSKVGVIPKDWDVVRLGDVAELTSSKRIYLSDYVKSGIPFYRGKEISELKKNKQINNLLFISINKYEEIKNKFGIPTEGDILITAVGTLGNIYRVKNSNKFYFKDGNLIWLKSIKAIPHFFEYKLEYDKDILIKSSIGSTQKALTIVALNKVNLSLPPQPEQQKIAKILTTWDNAIEQQQTLINQKQQLKKGLMQQLLTGKTRFTGFTDDWQVVKLGDIGEFKTSSVDKVINQDEQIVKLVNYMDVYRNKHISNDFECSETSIKYEKFEKVSLKKGDILFTPSSETPDDIGNSAVIIEDLPNTVYSYHLIRFRSKKLLDINFSGYVFHNQSILKEFVRRATGSTRFTLSIKDFNDIYAEFPSLPEQQKIAEVLINADKEIELLKNELNELKQQKKALMQKLLTGKVRVKL